MIWNEWEITCSFEAKEAIVNILIEAGANGVLFESPQEQTMLGFSSSDDWNLPTESHYNQDSITIKAYFADDDNYINLEKLVTERINNLSTFGIDVGFFMIHVDQIKESDWNNEWKKHFKPSKITRQFVVVPIWEDYEKTDDELVIYMEPGMAFGTGSHMTTVLTLQALEKVLQRNDVVIDVGSGSGILSIASCLLGAERVYSYDLDIVAVKNTRLNSRLNHLEHKIITKQNDLMEGVTYQANVIVANLLSHIILEMAEDAWSQLYEDGFFICSGIIAKYEQLVYDKLKEVGFHKIEKLTDEKWITFIAQK